MKSLANAKVAVIGLGYVGLPLAVEFGKIYPTVGYDINRDRVVELQAGKDSTLEVTPELLSSADKLSFSSNAGDIAECNIYVVTVPTPVNRHNQPDLTPLIKSSEAIGRLLKVGDIVIYESTVYPGATEEVCVPILEETSGLTFNQDFFVGYSPERINPGDHERRLPNILKVTSGSNEATSDLVDQFYQSIILAGTYKASSIKVAEAAKVIENTQRDVNIALINELAVIFNRLQIDTEEVLKAAGTKWNFLPFRPGLVGGHCIGVDPYYLTHKAQEIGYHPEIILSGRRLNDSMGEYVAAQLVKGMIKQSLPIKDSKVLVLGFSFKENCPDFRNTKVIDVIEELKEFGITVECYDPWVDSQLVEKEYGVRLVNNLSASGSYDAAVLAVAHEQFKTMGSAKIREHLKPEGLIYDLKYLLDKSESDLRL